MTVEDEKNLNDQEPDIPFAQALAEPMPAASAPIEATPTTPTAVPLGDAPAKAAAPAPTPAANSGGVYHVPNLGRQPKSITCPNCHQASQTETDSQVDAYTIVFCVLLFLLFWPLFWLPFVLPPCKATVHVCPKCRKRLGKTPTCCG